MDGRFKQHHPAIFIDRNDEAGVGDEIAFAPGAVIPGGVDADQVVGSAFLRITKYLSRMSKALHGQKDRLQGVPRRLKGYAGA